jgi:F-type H+-transporting ATPase subunit b
MVEIQPQLIPTIAQLIPFFLTLIALHFIIFKPMIEFLQDRENSSTQAKTDAERLHALSDERLEELNTQLQAARKEVNDVRNQARGRAKIKETELLDAARSVSEQAVQEGRAELAIAQKSASATLEATVKTLSAAIATQVLGRTGNS